MGSKKIFTLCIVHQDSKVLLGLKKRGFGVGRWNGFGGKVEEGESIKDAVVREIEEEVGIIPLDLVELGVLDFSFRDDPKTLEVHIFKVRQFRQEPRESEEMRPRWFLVDQIPFDQMWSDDIYWFPHFLADKTFRGEFFFDRPSDATHSSKILKHKLEVHNPSLNKFESLLEL